MKKNILLIAAALALSPAVQAKVSYEDALSSSSNFYTGNNTVNAEPITTGLDSNELQESASTESAMELIWTGNSNSYTVSEPGYYIVHSTPGTSQIYVTSLSGTVYGTSTSISNDARGLISVNGRLSIRDYHGRTNKLYRVYRIR